MTKNYSFVLDSKGRKLAPCNENKAWILIRKKKARLLQKYPMVIQLNYEVELKEESEIICGIDDESKHVGISLVQKCKTYNKPVFKGTIELRQDVKNLMDRINSGKKVKAHPLPTADKIYAERADKETQVPTSWDDILTAHAGDIIAYKVNGDGSVDRNDSWVVNKDIFKTTYERAENKLVSRKSKNGV